MRSRPSYRPSLVLGAFAAVVVLTGSAVAVPASAAAPDSPPAWDVPHHSETTSGATIVTTGHVDIASLVEGDALRTTIKDDSDPVSGVTYRDPAETVLQVRPEAQTVVPAAETYAFLGAPGESVWLLPETQQEDLLWPGWSTELIPGGTTTGAVQWRLDRASGPGDFTLFQTPFAGPTVLFSTRDGITPADSYEIRAGVHAHGSWAFSAAGVYCLDFDRSAVLAAGPPVADDFTLAIAVGETDVRAVDPAECFRDPAGEPAEPDTTPTDLAGLDEGNTGAVRVLEGQQGFAAGELVTVQLDPGRAEQWVSVWLDDRSWLGWAEADSSGAVRIRLPLDATPGSHVIVVEDPDDALVGWSPLKVVPPADPGDGDPDDPGAGNPAPPGVWDVPNGTVNHAGATVLNNGHVDVASVVTDGALDTQIKDGTRSAEQPTWREPAQTVLQLLPDARSTVPSGDQWGFLGAAGEEFYQVEQSEQRGLLWPGWSTEAIARDATEGGVAWALTDISGPGHFALYSTGSFGELGVLFSTRDGVGDADRFTIPKSTHAHASWAFSEQGHYCLSMQRTARMSGGAVSSDRFVLAVAVGAADVMSVDPARCGETVSTAPVDVPPPPADAQADAGAAAAQEVAATQCVAKATILSAGHIDYASRVVNGKLESLVGDDTSGVKVYRDPEGTILWLKPSSRVTLPGGFGAIGSAGSSIWQVPQTQNPNLIWLGWNTESLNAGNADGPVRWTIDGIEGPGSMHVYQSGSFGGVQSMVFDGGGEYSIPLGVHAHANWAFSAPGIYRITSTQTVSLADGRVSRDTETLTIAVGDIDPRSAVATEAGCAAVSSALLLTDDEGERRAAGQVAAASAVGPDRSREAVTTADDAAIDPLAALGRGDSVPLLLSILGALLLLGAAGAGSLWWRRGARDGAKNA